MLALVIILGLDLVAAFIDEIGKTEGDYNALQVLQYLFVTSPGRIYEFIPFAALIGSLLSLGQLSTNSELVVMRASGVALSQIIWTILKPVLIVALIASLLGELVVPITNLKAENRRTMLKNKVDHRFDRYGVWNREGNTLIHFEAVSGIDKASGITIYKFDAQRSLKSVIRASTGIFKGDHWLLLEVKKTDFFPWENKGTLMDSLKWYTSITPRVLLLDLGDPAQFRISDLYYYINYLAEQGRDSGLLELAFWRKLFFPLTLVGLVFVGSSFIFGPVREGSVGFRVFIGAMVGVIFKVSEDLIGPSSLVFGFSPALAAILPAFGCGVLGSILIIRAS